MADIRASVAERARKETPASKGNTPALYDYPPARSESGNPDPTSDPLALLRGLPDAVVANDAEGRVTFLNPAAEALTGWSRAAALGRPVREVLRMERCDAGYAPGREGCPGLRSGPRPGTERMEAEVVGRDGRLVPVEAATALLRDREGGPVRGVARILRERPPREGVTASRDARWRDLAGGSQDIFFSLSRHGFLTSLNPAFERVTGWAPGEWLGRPFLDLLHPSDREASWEAVRQALAGRTLPAREMRILSRSGAEVLLECACTPSLEEGRMAGAWGVARDITHRRRLEERALQAQKMEAITRVAGGIAHDFNNLLTAINGYADFLRQSLSAGNPLHANVDGILSSAARAADLTRRLQAFSGRKPGQPRAVDLPALVRSLLPTLQEHLEDGIRLETELSAEPCPVLADPGELEQALLILAANAREAMPRGGTLRLRAAPAGTQGSEPGAGPQVILAVSDTGCGMDDAVKARLFEPFFTTKPVGKGMGLGLSTVYGYVKQAGGDIQVESAPGKGTEFRLAFPRLAAAIADRTATSPESARGGETVLLVEDDEDVRFLLYSILKADGYAVLEARDGEHALELAGAHRGPIHLVLTDLHMPRLGGRRLAEALLPRHAGLKVLFMSGFAEERPPAADGGPGAGFLQKPFMPKSMLRQIRKVLDA